MQNFFFRPVMVKTFVTVLGAIVKNSCNQAVNSSKKIIGTSQDVFDHCEQRLTSIKSQTEGEEKTVSKRQFILVKGIKRDRPETNVNTLKGTRKLHAVRSTGHDYNLETRKLSCYCLNCLEEIDQCQNIDYCHRWETQTLKVLKSTTRKQLENMETEQDSMEVGRRRRHGNRSSGKYRLKSTGKHRNGPGKQIVRILSLKKNQYLQIKNISNQVCLQQSYFQLRKESQSQYALDKFLILMTKNFN